MKLDLHYMIDLETVGLRQDKGPVFQAAIVPFLIDGDGPWGEPKDWFNCLINPDQVQYGRQVEMGTLIWWLKENPALFAELMIKASEGVHLPAALDLMNRYMTIQKHTHNVKNMWANGPSFDIAFIELACAQLGLEVPWKYNAPRDVRISQDYNIFGGESDGFFVHPLEAEGAKHDAQVDCLRQIRYVQQFHRSVTMGMPPQ